MSVDTLTCPIDCSTPLPPVDFSVCAPKLLDAGFHKLLISNSPLLDWADPLEIAARISLDSTSPNAIRELVVQGSLAVAFGQSKKISGQRTVFGKQTFTYTFIIDDNSDANYEFMRATSCNRAYHAWPITTGNKMYGNNSGIVMILQGKEDIVQDDTAFVPLTFTGIVELTRPPIRIDYPLA